ncbi:MAG: hypothetical protein Q7S22_06800 [Candidatus Micrarchaeota archaeon]|nr:hypothetical protein [Candidatus Micrarchaeota archaeon]
MAPIIAQKTDELVFPYRGSNYQMSREALNLLEPIAKAWTGPQGSGRNYQNINDAWDAICRIATNGAPNRDTVTDLQAKGMANDYPKENNYNLKIRKPVVPTKLK